MFKKVLERNFHGVSAAIEEIAVPARTLPSLLDKYAIRDIGLLQIDTEGFDFEVIKMINFEKSKPVIINFEDGFLSRNARNACLELLRDQGYRVLKNGLDTVAYQQEAEASPFASQRIVTTLRETNL